MANEESFGAWLRARRRSRDLTREALAELVCCAAPTLAKIEQGTRRPSRELAGLILEALAVPPGERERAMALARLPVAAGDGGDAPEPGAEAAPPPALPEPPNRLVGREGELRLLRARLADPHCRAVTLVGPGGVGKTRLALAAAAEVAAERPGAVVWADASAAEDSAAMLREVARAAGLPRGAAPPDAGWLAEQLRGRAALLAVDNLEQVAGAAPALAEVLARAPGVRLLLTSRERLRLAGEWVVPLGGLGAPPEGPGAELERSDAARLFLERARQADAAFAPGPAEREAVAQICRALDGLPLAIELAAAWARALTCAEIAEELARGPALLDGGPAGSGRHASMRAVFDQSWRLLSEEERRALAALSVFRGGFTRAAAERVAGASLATLAALVDKSLLARRGEGGRSRYAPHELVRQLAAERLGEREAEVRAAHAEHVVGALAANAAGLQGGGQLEALAELEAERANIAHAWAWAAGRGDGALMQRGAPALLLMHELRGRLQDAAALLAGAAASRRGALPAGFSGRDRALGAICAWEGWARGRAGEVAAGQALLEEALRHLDGDGPALAATGALGSLGLLLHLRGRQAEARQALGRSLELLAQGGPPLFATLHRVFLLNVLLAEGDSAGALAAGGEALRAAEAGGNQRARLLARCGAALAEVAAGEPGRAQELARGALLLAAGARDRFGLALALLALGAAARRAGDLDEARYLLAESAEACRAIGDRWNQGRALHQLGLAALAAGDAGAARQALAEALSATLGHGIDGVAAGAAAELALLAGGDAGARLAAELRGRPELDAAGRARLAQRWPGPAAAPPPGEALADLLARHPAAAG